MSTNYDESKAILNGLKTGELYKEPQLAKASALATLALVDEMRAARAPELDKVFILHQYDPETDDEMIIKDVYRNREEAYSERDQFNALAQAGGGRLRYIIKERDLK